MRAWITLIVLVAGLLGYANVHAWRYARRIGAEDTAIEEAVEALSQLSRGHVAMIGLCLAWAFGERMTLRELGLGRDGVGKSAVWGLLLGLGGSAIIQSFLAFPPVGARFLPPPEWKALGDRRLAAALFGPMLIGSALFEEIAFRSLLHAKLGRLLSTTRGLLVGGAVFAAWHAVITWCNLSRCGLPRAIIPSLYGASLAGLFGVGVSMGLLRHATGHIIGGILAHWLLLAGAALAFARASRSAGPSVSDLKPSAAGAGSVPPPGAR